MRANLQHSKLLKQKNSTGKKMQDRKTKTKPAVKPISAFEAQQKDFEKSKEVYLSYFRTFGFDL